MINNFCLSIRVNILLEFWMQHVLSHIFSPNLAHIFYAISHDMSHSAKLVVERGKLRLLLKWYAMHAAKSDLRNESPELANIQSMHNVGHRAMVVVVITLSGRTIGQACLRPLTLVKVHALSIPCCLLQCLQIPCNGEGHAHHSTSVYPVYQLSRAFMGWIAGSSV